MRKFNLWVQLQQSENISKSTLRVKMSKHNFLRLECTKKKSSTFRKKNWIYYLHTSTFRIRLFIRNCIFPKSHHFSKKKKSHKILIEL